MPPKLVSRSHADKTLQHRHNRMYVCVKSTQNAKEWEKETMLMSEYKT